MACTCVKRNPVHVDAIVGSEQTLQVGSLIIIIALAWQHGTVKSLTGRWAQRIESGRRMAFDCRTMLVVEVDILL